MPLNLIQKFAFRLYELSWCSALPLLRRNHRLAEGFQQRTLKIALPAAHLWIQAASVGEAYLAIEIIKGLEPVNSLKILITSNTSQGVEILERNLSDHPLNKGQIQPQVGYFPFDKPGIMQRAVADIDPKVMVLLETELWPALLKSLKDHGCKVLIVNGRLTEKSLKKYLLGHSFWKELRPDKILAISPADARRFKRIFGQTEVELMSNIKFDRIVAATPRAGSNNKLKGILPDDRQFIVLASIRQAEETQVVKIIQSIIRTRPDTAVGLFPRHMHRIPYWQNMLDQAGVGYILRSAIDRPIVTGNVILWDTLGELLPAYRLAEAAFVGGSLAPLGGQNFLEALVSGVIPIIGPSWENFAWVGRGIIESGLLRVAGDWKQVVEFLANDLANPSASEDVIDAALQFLKTRRGGTEKACRRIITCLERV